MAIVRPETLAVDHQITSMISEGCPNTEVPPYEKDPIKRFLERCNGATSTSSPLTPKDLSDIKHERSRMTSEEAPTATIVKRRGY